MRARELYEERIPSRYDPEEDVLNVRHFDDTRKPKLTLRALNRLKKIKAVRKFELLKKQGLIQLIYGDQDLAQEARERDLDFENKQRELEILKGEIELMIDGAEIDREKKDHVSDMAQNAMGRARKS